MKPDTPRGAEIMRSLRTISSLRSSPALTQRIGEAFVITVIYVLVAAAAFNGYYTKWQMSDSTPRQSLALMLDGTAARPYVFRQLLPQTATAIRAAMPDSVRVAIESRLKNAQAALKAPAGADANKEGYLVRYRIVYYATFFSLFLALFVLRSVCLVAGVCQAAATAAPAIFALMIPILQTRGGFFYDLPEVLAFALAARLALGGHILPLLLLAVPATANKESFFFFCLTLLPLLMVRLSLRTAIATTLGATLVSGLTYLAIRLAYAGNEGDNAIFQLFDNMLFYLNPLNLFMFDQSYGLPLFKGYGFIVLAWFAILIVYGWREVPRPIHDHLKLAAAINVPLLLLFCAEGEMRNLSMLYVPIVVLMSGALQRWMGATPEPTGRLFSGDSKGDHKARDPALRA